MGSNGDLLMRTRSPGDVPVASTRWLRLLNPDASALAPGPDVDRT
jgi:hypothetical protein